MSSVVISGNTSGTITLDAPAVAGTTTLTLPATSGTVALTASPTFTGQATIPTINLTGGQITFPATAVPSADANTLDDYEEGTWTPVFTASTPGTFSATYSIQLGAYNKIGNLVIASFSMAGTTTKGTASGDFLISGLPFNVANTGSDQFSGCIGFMNPVLPSSPIGLLTFNNSPSIYIGLVAGSTLQVSAVTNATYGIRGTIIYRASA
jgi:hypothetical protein